MKNLIFIIPIALSLFSCQNKGCIDPSASNHDIEATKDDGSCTFLGCTDTSAVNFDFNANLDDGSCEWQKRLTIHFNTTQNGQKIEINDVITFDNNALRIERFQFYLCNPSLAFDDMVFNLSDVFLYNLENDENSWSLNVAKNNYNYLNIGLGLNENLNSTSANDYSPDHPLGINSGNFWPMEGGSFIFVKLDGKLDTIGNGEFHNVSYHLSHNEIFKSFNISNDFNFEVENEINLNINIELKKFFDNVNLERKIPHTSTNSELAHLLMQNLANAFEVQ